MSKERQRPARAPEGAADKQGEPMTPLDACVTLAQQLAGQLEQLATSPQARDVALGEAVIPMAEADSVQLRAGKRTYFLDVAHTGEGKPYLRITESRFTGETGERERNTIFVFPEEAAQFAQAVAGMAARVTAATADAMVREDAATEAGGAGEASADP